VCLYHLTVWHNYIVSNFKILYFDCIGVYHFYLQPPEISKTDVMQSQLAPEIDKINVPDTPSDIQVCADHVFNINQITDDCNS